ncbi:hypothetical protein BCE75_109138 [Isoptericola sp. CG 20/1183]|uniref:LysM domain-containing protein n=1 Tax=Isoptericola halotolerans TaxID=300560 RepID=A0ABX5EBL3_9MICO|nr:MULTISPECIES: hypothetical protein [Isoptericola]PRZ04899.1 hypothetical protein BCL65_109139 [Isoptericola halotolerans]PRZ05390.1 hypothetical protein BCE75_109138 [Isoptericola sp. CG 20/1183]
MARTSRDSGAARSTAALLTLLAASGGALLLLALRLSAVAPTDPDAVRSARVETWVELLVLTGGLAGAGWMLLGTAAALAGVAAVRRGRSTRTAETVVGRWAPAIVRRLARGAVGAGLGAGLLLAPGAAHADEAPTPAATPAAVLELGWEATGDSTDAVSASAEVLPGPATAAEPALPQEPGKDPEGAGPVDEPSPAVGSAQRTSHQDDGADEVVVVRGDTLWAIAARGLPDDAPPADVLRAVTSWHDANRDVIGDDPDVVLPGQVLRAP